MSTIDDEEEMKDYGLIENKESVIIDGVNVEECKYFLFRDKEEIPERSCGVGLVNCKGQDCMFKQLQRLKAENEQLKQALEEIREDMQQDTTCESRECGCDDYAECINCMKETIINKINEVLNNVGN